jgi:hypothetical protein
MHAKFLCISEAAAGKRHDFISNQGKAFAHWSRMTVSTRDRLHNSSFFQINQSSGVISHRGQTCIKAKTAVSIQRTPEEMGHSQSCTPIQTNNLTAQGLLMNKILPKALKAMDMQFHWLHCCSAQDQEILLEAQDAELSRLLDQASPGQTPQIFLATNSDICYRSRVHQINYSKEHCSKILHQEHPTDTPFCKTNSYKTSNNYSPECLIAQRQGCVRLTQIG